jgi:hypothetical protein
MGLSQTKRALRVDLGTVPNCLVAGAETSRAVVSKAAAGDVAILTREELPRGEHYGDRHVTSSICSTREELTGTNRIVSVQGS